MRVPEKIKASRRKLRADRIAPRVLREHVSRWGLIINFNLINTWEAVSRSARRCISRTSFHYIAKDEPLICEKSGF